MATSICSVEVCDQEILFTALCAGHYRRKRAGKPLGGLVRKKRTAPQIIQRNSQGEKHCSLGDHWDPESNFARDVRRADRLHPACLSCVSLRRRVKQYGITLDKYTELLSLQGGACAICGTDDDNGAWCIDHDHSCCPGDGSCGKCVRGLLCRNCNWGLGHFRDDIKLLAAASIYLEG